MRNFPNYFSRCALISDGESLSAFPDDDIEDKSSDTKRIAWKEIQGVVSPLSLSRNFRLFNLICNLMLSSLTLRFHNESRACCLFALLLQGLAKKISFYGFAVGTLHLQSPVAPTDTQLSSMSYTQKKNRNKLPSSLIITQLSYYDIIEILAFLAFKTLL